MEEELLLEKHDLALCTISESNRFLPSDSQEGRCGSSAPTIWLEDEGDIGCDDSHTVTETDKGSHPIEESSRPFQMEEHPRSLFQSEIVGGDDDIELDHNLLFYSVQSIENLDTMFPEISEKCTELEENVCSSKLKQDDSCLEAELNLIRDPKLDQTPFWSILTDTLTYPDHKINQQQICSHKARSKAIASESNAFYSTYYFLEKKKQNDKITEPAPEEQLKADTTDIQKSEVDKQFGDVTGKILKGYDPRVDISTTYLHSTPEGQVLQEDEMSVFPTGVIPLTGDLKTVGKLMNGTPCKTLFDSGATSSIISTSFYRRNKILHSYPKYNIPKINVKIANDSIMTATQAIKIVVNLRGHVFEIIADLLDLGQSLDLIFGVKSATEVEGKVDFVTQEFTFRQIQVKSITTLRVPPRPTIPYTAKLEKCPKDFENGTIMLKLNNEREDKLPQMLWAVCKDGKFKLSIKNHTDKELVFPKDETIGSADMRSVGYYFMSRTVIKQLLEDRFIFIGETDEEEELCQPKEEDPIEMLNKIPRPPLKGPLKTQLNVKPEKNNKSDKKEKYISGFKVDPDDKYPWLDKDDPCRNMTDREIIEKFVDLSKSELTEKEKKELYDLLVKYREAFSLRDEIGECPNMEIEIELEDETPFFIRPYPIKEEEKAHVDREMQKGCLLGILRKGLTSYSSPIMLIPRKQGGIPHIVTDFRYLNSRLKVLQCSMPLVRDAIQQLGAAGSEIVTIFDFRDAFHTLRIALLSQKYLGITPYYGSPTYIYQRLGVGLSISPSLFMHFITQVLDQIEY